MNDNNIMNEEFVSSLKTMLIDAGISKDKAEKLIAKQKYEFIKNASLKIIDRLKELIRSDKFDEAEEMLQHSSAGDGYGCENDYICGSTKNIDVHHKDGNYQNNSSENLMIVCRSCHMMLHRPKSTCVICGEPVKGHGYCNKHYIRWKKYMNPLMVRGKISESEN